MSTDLARRLRLVDNYGISLFGVFASLALGVTVLMLAIFLAVTLGGRAYGRPTCANWSNATGIPTKFVVLNWADSGTCLAQTPDGRWVLNSKWQAFVTGNKP